MTENGNGNGSLYKNLSLILNFFLAMLRYSLIYGSLKNLVSVFTSVLFSNGFLSNFKLKHYFMALLIGLVGN